MGGAEPWTCSLSNCESQVCLYDKFICQLICPSTCPFSSSALLSISPPPLSPVSPFLPLSCVGELPVQCVWFADSLQVCLWLQRLTTSHACRACDSEKRNENSPGDTLRHAHCNVQHALDVCCRRPANYTVL